ncbi:MAG: DNA polymerase IV [Ferroplasma sp.]
MPFIIFIDFDYFYAQVEEIMNPEIKERPVVVCVYSGRNETSGAVATSNYIARSIGIKSGMPISQALKLGIDNAVFIPIRKDFYKSFSDRVMKIIASYSDIIEIASIDEAYIDVTDSCSTFSDAVELASEIKKDILKETGLRVSAGISSNKVLAKILGDMAKPDGIKFLDDPEIGAFLSTLEMKKIPGIGTVLSKKLSDEGVIYINDIIKADKNAMLSILGNSKYNYLLSIASNTYKKPVENRIRKNYGRYITLPEDTRDPGIIMKSIDAALNSSYEKVPGMPMEISLIAIMEDLDIISRTYSGRPINKEEAEKLCADLLSKIMKDDTRKLRRIGVRLSKPNKNESLDDFFA